MLGLVFAFVAGLMVVNIRVAEVLSRGCREDLRRDLLGFFDQVVMHGLYDCLGFSVDCVGVWVSNCGEGGLVPRSWLVSL